MIRSFVCLLLFAVSLSVVPGCGGAKSPAPLSPEDEQRFEQELEDAQRAEGAAQSNEE
ncbi:MAG: hypothetical protein U1E05_15605 [Patescibacteria group bacterium]|nr:hypothetical protein [Patescibacteria group bacterium]